VTSGNSPETLRRHTLRTGEQLRAAPADKLAAAPESITVTADSTFIRSRDNGERHLEVHVGNVETAEGSRRVFAGVASSNTDIADLIRRNLETVGRTSATTVTAFTDGCSGLIPILAAAGVTQRPVADWFHIAMRLQHAKLAASGLSTDKRGRITAKAAIIKEVERLRWRIWHGKAKDAQLTLERIRKVMHVFRGERAHRTKGVASRKLWHALHEVDNYLRGQECAADQLRRAIPCGTASWHIGDGGFCQFPGQSADEQVAADALVATGCRPAAASSLRGLQRRVRLRLRAVVRTPQPLAHRTGHGSLIGITP